MLMLLRDMPAGSTNDGAREQLIDNVVCGLLDIMVSDKARLSMTTTHLLQRTRARS